MARRKKPGTLAYIYAGANALAKIEEQRYKNKREAIRLQRDRQALRQDHIKTRHAALKFRKDRETTRGIILKNEAISLENDLKAARIKEIEQRTKELQTRNKLNEYKLHQLDPSTAKGDPVYQCPNCEDYFTDPAPNYLFCDRDGCDNTPLIKTVLNLN